MERDSAPRHLFGLTLALVSVASIGMAHALPSWRGPEAGAGVSVEKIGCWWTYGAWGPHRVCRDDDDYDRGHYDWHQGHWDRHYDHYDWHPGHWDYHHNGHRHHLDEE